MSHEPGHSASRIHQKVVVIDGQEVVRLTDETGNPISESAHADHSEGGGATTSNGVTMDQMYDALVALQSMITDNKSESDAFANAANTEIVNIKARLDALEAA